MAVVVERSALRVWFLSKIHNKAVEKIASNLAASGRTTLPRLFHATNLESRTLGHLLFTIIYLNLRTDFLSQSEGLNALYYFGMEREGKYLHFSEI
jgi:hypothetical protein